MKIIHEPKIAITAEELTKLQDLRGSDLICGIINCEGCSCNGCPFGTLAAQVEDLLTQAAKIAEALPIYEEDA